jgi:2'-aminobiphenyl-2,3-diol 1,2-dioxygenase, small subunit
MSAPLIPPWPPRGVHELIEHLLDTPADRPLIRSDPDLLFDRFQVSEDVRETLRNGGRDDLYRLGIHPNFIVKWLIWSGRPSLPVFPLDYYFSRR